MRWQVTSFKWSQVPFYFFKNSYEICCVYVTMAPTIKILISNWPRTRKFSQLFKHTGGLVNIWYVTSCATWSWQSFVSTCDVFNCLFPLDEQNEIQLLSRVFCFSRLVCLLGFLVEKCVAYQSQKSDFGWTVNVVTQFFDRIGLSWNFKMLHWINLNESFRPYYIHYEDYVKRF